MIERKTIPNDPGCYVFYNSSGEILYIGKAKSLITRVTSYLGEKKRDDKTARLVSQIDSVQYFVTANEIEALILENTLIRKHKPRFNIDLKESKRYAYLCVTDEKYPRLIVARDTSTKGKYFGPFVNAEYRDVVKTMLTKAFQIRTCSRLPKRACLRYHLKICSAPCIDKISQVEYAGDVAKVVHFLKGNVSALVSERKREMKQASDLQLYEKAKLIRDQITALKHLTERQTVERENKYDEDIINYVVHDGKVYILIFNIHHGTLSSKQEFVYEEMEGHLDQFITQYYSQNPVPRKIIVPHNIDDPILEEYLSSLRGGKVECIVPKRGTYVQLLALAMRNIEIAHFGEDDSVVDLMKRLRLNSYPRVIECFDISHIQGSHVVASMAQFYNGKKNSSQYRRYKIREQVNDDFQAMAEVVKRRYTRLKAEGVAMPDLIVIDGGQGQMTVALKALDELELTIPIIALAKKMEAIFEPGSSTPILLSKETKALKLLMQIRDEAHRFAVTYHRLLRSKGQLASKSTK